MAEVFHWKLIYAYINQILIRLLNVGNIDAGNQELSQLISELQAKLEDANAETLSEREKVVETLSNILWKPIGFIAR